MIANVKLVYTAHRNIANKEAIKENVLQLMKFILLCVAT